MILDFLFLSMPTILWCAKIAECWISVTKRLYYGNNMGKKGGRGKYGGRKGKTRVESLLINCHHCHLSSSPKEKPTPIRSHYHSPTQDDN